MLDLAGSSRSGIRRRISALVMAAILFPQGAAAFAASNWASGSNGNFSDPTKWTAGVPGSADTAIFSLGAGVTYSVGFPGGTFIQPVNYATDRLLVGSNTVSIFNPFSITHPQLASYTVNNAATSDAGRGILIAVGSSDTAAVLNTSLVSLSCGAATIGDANLSNGTLNVSGGSFNVTGSSTTDDELIIGNHGTGALNITNGATVNVSGANGDSILGKNAGTGMATITGAGSTFNAGSTLYVGFNGTGTLNVSGGGQVNSGTGYVRVSGVGTATIDGAGSKWTNSGDLNVSATLNIINGGQVSNANGYLSDATANIVGAGSKWFQSGNLNIGQAGNASLYITDGAQVSDAAANVGIQSGFGLGTVAVEGAGSTWANSGMLNIGETAVGSLRITLGGQVTSAGGNIGHMAGSAGTVAVDGTGSAWINSGTINVGGAGGSLQITHGGRVTGIDGVIGAGTVTIDGSGSKWICTATLSVGDGALGTLSTLNIFAGAQMSNAGGQIGYAPHSLGSVTVDGVGSIWTNSGTLDIGGSGGNGMLNITGGGQVNSAGDAHMAIGNSSTGSVTVDGTGSTWSVGGNLIVNDTGSTETSPTLTVRNGGVISVGGTNGVELFFSTGTLKGNGTIAGNVFNGGVVAPGSAVGALHVNGNYTQATFGQLLIELAGTTPGTQYDQLLVSGTVALGGTLQVSLMNGFTPIIGNAFDILDWGSLGGAFATLQLPALGSPLVWDTSKLYITGVLAVSGPTVLGDFNRDGRVTAADIPAMLSALTDLNSYAVTNSLSPTQLASIGDFDNSGSVTNRDIQGLLDLVISQGGGTTDSVPEPSTLCLLIIGAGAMIVRRRRK